MNVRFTNKAQVDLDQIRSFISQENPSAASRLVTRLIELSRALSDNPKEGRTADEPGVHVLIVPRLNYLIFYRLAEAEIQILHIRHASRSRWRP
jgi:toxin ParE1/3/4